LKKTIFKFVVLFVVAWFCAQFLLILAFVGGILTPRSLAYANLAATLGGLVIFCVLFVRKLKQLAALAQNSGQVRPSSTAQVFENVWYSPPKKLYDLQLLVYRDIGRLIIRENSIEFQGRSQKLSIERVRHISYGKHGRDFINNWVSVEYGDASPASIALFADGTMHGWGGVAGGTKRIFEALRHSVEAKV
jgi:hypothetical protein